MNLFWKRLAAQSIFLLSLTALFCMGVILQARADKTLSYAWGYNRYGQLGDGTYTDKSIAQGISGMSDVKQIAGGNHSLALKLDGSVWGWGRNVSGEIGDGTGGDGTNDFNKNLPVKILGITNIVQVAVGGGHSFALKSDGTVWIWGSNEFWQLGDGTQIDRSRPFQVPGLSGVVQASGGGSPLSCIEVRRNCLGMGTQ